MGLNFGVDFFLSEFAELICESLVFAQACLGHRPAELAVFGGDIAKDGQQEIGGAILAGKKDSFATRDGCKGL